MSEYKFNTSCIHSGYKAESGKPQVLPIVQNTTYRYYDAEDVAKLFDLESGRKDGSAGGWNCGYCN